MIFARKPKTPIDRAVAELEAQIAALKDQLRRGQVAPNQPPPPPRSWWDWFLPPSRRAPSAMRRPLPEVPVEPLKELEDSRWPFERQPDLFHRPAPKAQDRFVGRPPLRYIRRLAFRRLCLWLSLGVVVLALLWLVMH